MSTAGFHRFRESTRFSSLASPTTLEELTETRANTWADQDAGFTEVVKRQQTVTSLKGGNLFVRNIAVPDDPIAPDGNVRVKLAVSNGALASSIFDKDGCRLDDFDPLGGDRGYKT